MFEVLGAYLDKLVTPEQRAVCLDACNTLLLAGIDDHAFLLEQDMAMAEDFDGDFLLGIVNGTLGPIYKNILAQFGVRLVEDATLVQATDVLKALHGVDNYDDQETMLGYCDGTDGEVAILADILSLIGSYHSTDYLTILDYVSPSLIERIAALCTKENVDELPADAIVERCRVRLRKFLQLAPMQAIPEPLAIDAVDDGARLGTPLDLLIEPWRTRLEELPPAILAGELVGFALASDLDNALIHSAISQQVDHFQFPMARVTAIDVAVQKLLAQVFNA